MEQISLQWHLVKDEDEIIEERYCHNCGRKTSFIDTGVRRHNANGKNIYQFAIYKCNENHTWNKKLDIYKARTECELDQPRKAKVLAKINTIYIAHLQEKHIMEVLISIEYVKGKWRIDKLLSRQIEGVSRVEIVQWLKEEVILVNNVPVKPSRVLKEKDQLLVRLYKIIK